MQLSLQGAAFVRAHEGYRSKLYLDPVGIPTIGVGFTWRSTSFRSWWQKNKPGVAFKRGASITRAEADEALTLLFDEEYGAAVNRFLGKRNVPQHVFDAMASVTFNCGADCLKWKWAAAAKRGDYEESARRLRTTAVTARGKRLNGLVRRRKEEADLLLNGVYKGVSAPVKSDPLADGVLRFRERGTAVASLIKDLHALGYYDGVLDDLYGRGTEAAVTDFQRDNGLLVDGVAGPATLAEIDQAISRGHSKTVINTPESVTDIVKDAAAVDRISTTEIVAIGTGATGAANAVKETVEAVNDASVSIMSAGPWVLVGLLTVGFGAYIWRERRRKKREARAAL